MLATNISTIRSGTERSRAANVRTPNFYRNFPSLLVSFSDRQLEELRDKIQRERERRLSDDNAMAGFLSEAEVDADDDHITSVSRRTSTCGEGEGDNKSY